MQHFSHLVDNAPDWSQGASVESQPYYLLPWIQVMPGHERPVMR